MTGAVDMKSKDISVQAKEVSTRMKNHINQSGKTLGEVNWTIWIILQKD